MKSILELLFQAVEDRVVMIHDAKRTDRAQVRKLWANQHSVSVPLFSAVMLKDGRHGCAESHKRVADAFLHTGHLSELPYIVLEDDVFPTADAVSNISVLYDIMKAIQFKEFDLIYLGGLPLPGHTASMEPSIRVGKCIQTHAMLVFPKAAKYLATHMYRGTPIDADLLTADLKTGFVHPSLFDQVNSKSDVRRTALSQTEWFGAFLHGLTPIWRHAVVHQIEYAALLVLVAVLAFFKLKSKP